MKKIIKLKNVFFTFIISSFIFYSFLNIKLFKKQNTINNTNYKVGINYIESIKKIN